MREIYQKGISAKKGCKNLGRKLRVLLVAGLLFLGAGVCVYGMGMRVQAKNKPSTESLNYSINAEMVGSDRDSYTIQITVENHGSDWEGRMRLIPDQYGYSSYDSDAYDIDISLPQGSKKQFAVKVKREPDGSYSSSRTGKLRTYLLDKKGNVIADRDFDAFFQKDSQYIYMGILSDDFSSLTYLDLGGDELYLNGNNYPVKLKDLSQMDFKDSLAELDYLVIDQYNTGVLTADELIALSNWNYSGGVLMVGTGAYANEVLTGIGDYLEVKCMAVYPLDFEQQNSVYSDYYSYPGAGAGDNLQYNTQYGTQAGSKSVEFADLQDSQNRYVSSYYSNIPSLVGSQGDGAIMIMPFSLGELSSISQADMYQYGYGDVTVYARNMIMDAYNYASVRYDSNDYSENVRYLARMMNFWGNSSNTLNFTLLKFIIFLYVIFVGPILYLILKVAKKRELYWVFVPVTTLAAVGLVFFAGRGFKMVNTTVFSVTLENAAGRGEDTSFLYCYDANHTEWSLKLKEGYNFAGGLYSDRYSYDYDDDDADKYLHHMKIKGENVYFGLKPGASFQDSYFIARKPTERDPRAGQIICDQVLTSAALSSSAWGYGNIFGQITNETGEDFVYCLVVTEGSAFLYGELQNGDTLDLGTANPIYTDTSSYNLSSRFLYSCMDDENMQWTEKQIGQLTALGVGMASLYSKDDIGSVVVIGVTDSGENVVDDRCYETAYRCLYTIQ